MRATFARCAMVCAAALALVPLVLAANSSLADPPCETQADIDEALTQPPLTGGQGRVIAVPAECALSETLVFERADTSNIAYLVLTGSRITRAGTLTGPMLKVGPGVGLILRDIELDGGGANANPLPPEGSVLEVAQGATLAVENGGAVQNNASFGIDNRGTVTLAGTGAVRGHRLTVLPSDRLPGGAGIITHAGATFRMTGGTVADNTVVSAGVEGRSAQNVAGAGVLVLGNAAFEGGQITGNGFEVSNPAKSFGGGLATAYENGAREAGVADLVNAAGGPGPRIADNSAVNGGGVAVMGQSSLMRGEIFLRGGVIESNHASAEGGAVYVSWGVANLATGITIGGAEGRANTSETAGASGLVNGSGVVNITGVPQFGGGNGISAWTEATAPNIEAPFARAAGFIPFESIPYFDPAGGAEGFVAARVSGDATGLTDGDLAVFTQPDALVELVFSGDPPNTVLARYKRVPVTYRVPEGTTLPEANPLAVTPAGPAVRLRPAQLEGHHFDGWWDSATGGNQVETIPAGTTEPVELWGRFTPVYMVLYNSVSPERVENLPVDRTEYFGAVTATVLPLPNQAPPVRAGYEFTGWGTTAEGSEPVAGLAPGATLPPLQSNLELWAKWTAVVYPIDYHGDRGDNPETYTVEDPPIELQRLADIPGWRFAGWFDNDPTAGGRVVTALDTSVPGGLSAWSAWVPESSPVPDFTSTPTP
ncbi:MAG: InlB B-repeat-containing protein, partial [Bifidobacteriaceae bacterium]|nr:InlB B-repeat-containing protein [Bifidobacteriaceae bacterium]